jgi:pSer/pThr/pTyr-binding forkhead associated (FHA) protein
MPYIQFNDQRFPLSAAELTVGAYEGAALRLPGDDATLRAVLHVGADGTGLVKRGSAEAVVFVNGVQLGAEPSPLLHGDKLSLGAHELRYGDDVKGGSTQFLSSMNIPDALKARGSAPKKPTTATGGRLVSLVDGREYPVPDSGVTFGREIGNDIVIASTEVSRKHATIAPGEGGYVVTDLSTNGMTVNGVRVDKTQLLGRADVLKIGPEEYRFYADVAKTPAAPPVADAPPEAPPKAPTEAPSPAIERPLSAASAPPPAPPEAPALVADTPFGLGTLDGMPQIDMTVIDLEDAILAASNASPPAAPPATPPAAPATPPAAPARPAGQPSAASETPKMPSASRTPLATLEVINEGPMKGTKFEIHTPLTNVGRGPHNDVSLQDETVSDSHAKILKREGSWWLVDQGSTNGTYVGGRRVQGEQQLVGAPDVRFGSIKMMFKSTPVPAEDDGKGTRAIAAFSVDAARKAAEKKRGMQAAPQQPEAAQLPAEKKKGCMAMIAFLLAVGVAGASMIAILLTIRG